MALTIFLKSISESFIASGKDSREANNDLAEIINKGCKYHSRMGEVIVTVEAKVQVTKTTDDEDYYCIEGIIIYGLYGTVGDDSSYSSEENTTSKTTIKEQDDKDGSEIDPNEASQQLSKRVLRYLSIAIFLITIIPILNLININVLKKTHGQPFRFFDNMEFGIEAILFFAGSWIVIFSSYRVSIFLIASLRISNKPFFSVIVGFILILIPTWLVYNWLSGMILGH